MVTSNEDASDNFDDSLEENGNERMNSNVPIDRGWAWVTLLGAFAMCALIGGFLKSFGVLLLELSRRYSAPASLLTSSQSICSCLQLALGPLSNALSIRFSHRKIVFLGGLLAGVGLILTAFIQTVELFFVTYGLLTGFGFGLCVSPTLVFPSYYFNKRLAIANGISVAGAGLGAVVFPNLMRFLLTNYLIEGCLIIFGGIMFNLCICASLLRPVSFWTKSNIKLSKKTIGRDKTYMNDTFIDANAETKDTKVYSKIILGKIPFSSCEIDFGDNKALTQGRSFSASVPCFQSEMDKYNQQREIMLLQTTRSKSQCLNKNDLTHSISFYASLESLPLPNMERQYDEGINTDSQIVKKKRKIINWKLIKDPIFQIFNVSIFFGSYAHNTIYNFMPPLANELGLSDTQGALAISIIGFSDLAGRISGGFLSDTLSLQRRTTYQISMLIFGVCTVVVVHIPNATGFFITCGCIGIFLGGFIGTQIALLVEALGQKNLSSSFGFVAFFSSIALLINPVIAGAMKDYTGSWIPALRLGSATAIAGAILPSLKLLLDRKRNNK